MGFSDQLTRFFQFKDGGQKAFGVKDPYIFKLEDDTFLVCDPADTTKCIRFDAGNVTAGATRVITLPDLDTTLGNSAGSRRQVISADAVDATAVVTLTDAMSGSLIDLDLATVTVNLPALTSANSGANGIWFEFENTITATAQIIAAASGDIVHGGVTIMSTGAGVENDAFSSNGSSNLVTTMNGTTKGGIIGSKLWFNAESATKWVMHGNLIGSGTIVTPFSDT